VKRHRYRPSLKTRRNNWQQMRDHVERTFPVWSQESQWREFGRVLDKVTGWVIEMLRAHLATFDLSPTIPACQTCGMSFERCMCYQETV